MSENWYDSRSQGGFFFFRERTTASALATMGIAIIGVMMIGWGDFGLSGQAMLGDLLSVLSVIAVVGYLLIGQSAVKMMSHWLYSFCVFMFAAEFFTIDNIVTNTTFLSYSRLDWSMFVLLATVPTLSHLNQ